MEIFQFVVAIAAGIGASYAAVKAIAALIRWLRTWKIIKLQEFKRLKVIEAEHQKCEAEKERLRKLDNPTKRSTLLKTIGLTWIAIFSIFFETSFICAFAASSRVNS